MAKVWALKMVPTAKLPKFELKPSDTLHCFLTMGAATQFAMSQLSMAHENKLFSWAIDHPTNPEKQLGIGMSFVRYEVDMPDELVRQMTLRQTDPTRPTNYIGAVQPNGVQLPKAEAYITGKDDGGKFGVHPAAETDIVALVQERKNVVQAKADALEQRAANRAAHKEESIAKMRASRAASIEEMKADPTEQTPGSALITRHRQMLLEQPDYNNFIRNLEASYRARSLRDPDDTSGMKAAHEALVDVYGQIRKAAVKNNDFEMATFAHNTVEAAQSYLIALDHEKKYASEQESGGGISRQELEELGIHVPEHDEW